MIASRFIIFIFLLTSIGINGYANPGSQAFIETREWSKLSKDYDFTENIKRLKEKKKEQKKKTITATSSPSQSGNAWMFPVLVLVIIILLVILLMLIMNIYKGTNERVSNKNLTVKNLDIDDIEHIEDADLNDLLQQAIRMGLFKDAIRIRYLMLIRKLTRLNFVTWKKDKTNGAYISEMYGKNGFELFKQVTLKFDRIWYGEKNVLESDYYALIPLFDEINNTIAPSNQSITEQE